MSDQPMIEITLDGAPRTIEAGSTGALLLQDAAKKAVDNNANQGGQVPPTQHSGQAPTPEPPPGTPPRPRVMGLRGLASSASKSWCHPASTLSPSMAG